MLLWLLLPACAPENALTDGNDNGGDTDVIHDPETWDSDHDGTADNYDCAPFDGDIHPAASELCDEQDNNCDGVVDDGFDLDGDGFLDLHDCYAREGDWDCDDDVATTNPGADETCNGVDDDCDDEIDEIDVDQDGITFCDGDCDDQDPFVYPDAAEACDAIDNDCDGRVDELWDSDGDEWSPCAGDCDDDDRDFHPGALETCDGLDNDCDELVDEDDDLDGDGQATCAGDCDDTEPTVYVGAPEICDGLDNDCVPATDENVDADGDGYSTCAGDCDENSVSAYPGAAEACDSLDNDCNGYADELPSCWSCTTESGYYDCETATAWATAALACEGMGGYLAKIQDSSENSTIAALAITPTWIGANDIDTENNWVWTDGNAVGYDDWASGEPDDAGDADCAITNNSGRRGEWADMRCESEYRFVCEL